MVLLCYKLTENHLLLLYSEVPEHSASFSAKIRETKLDNMVISTAKILVGVSLNEESSTELLSWAIGIAARPGDTVVALHVLVRKDEKKLDMIAAEKTRMRLAKAFVISSLGDLTELCQSKQVNVEAKVCQSVSIGKGLVEEAGSLQATFLLVGCSRNQSQRPSLGITKYCFKYAPEGCSVIAIGKRSPTAWGFPQPNSDPNPIPSEASDVRSNWLSTKLSNRDIGKAVSSLPKLFLSKLSRENSFRKSKKPINQQVDTNNVSGRTSPRAVLDGPGGGGGGGTHLEDQFTPESSTSCESQIEGPKSLEIGLGITPQGRSSIWKHLPTIKLFSFSLFQIPNDEREGLKGKKSFLPGEGNPRPSWGCFSYQEIAQATNNFHPGHIVGRGGYAEVYKGYLSDGKTIAVKRLAKDMDEKKEKEFLIELGVIGHVCHPNTAYLIGCCIENGLHLIFNFSPHGSLASVLHGRNSELLDWPIRYKIAAGVARGLHYLHKCCKHRIIHRDIKASNVLLGEDFEPQISDFGLAKWLPKQWTHHSVTPIEGTFGYLAPEYFMHGIVDEKTDVFAFGVLLLEIISGRRPVDVSKQNLLSWAKPLLESGNINALVDPKLGGKYNMEEVQRLVLTASYCVRQSAIWRPSMTEVLQLISDGYHSKAALSWRMPEYRADLMDEYIMDVDYQSPTSHHF
ncbi:hypothetical protein AMTRI_Chr04g182710 [Amborella trichopoda]|uniref:Protein kinase domain-containing protein n=1 Tax=Amborella trichopoda TaxID=13333 RepID=W1NHL2_AMBTC|nr:probable receptor-like serine/threonine-protein kinase At5g57670 isoform X1 [Amborella trichopoda]ERM95272.1 hypothetical protein AMTR_s00008p00064820 [Amborella trichopoda]|eukprot:XP_020529158.1 probable receptor-like serine/threonine-protein kinase At5g57670 isoform X1 [Amborella trichopoda]